MDFFVCILTDIVHFFTILIVCKLFFSFQRRDDRNSKLMWFVAPFGVSVISVTIYFLENHIIESLIYVVSIVIICYMLYSEKIYTIFIVILWTLFALSVVDIMASFLVKSSFLLFGMDKVIITNFVASAITVIFVYGLGQVYKKHSRHTLKTIGYINLIGFTVLLALDSFVVTAIATQPIITSDVMGARNPYLLAIVLVVIGTFIQLAAVIILFTQRNVHKEKEHILDVYLNEQKNHYEYLENRERETKKFRHDLRNHLDLISNLAKSQEYDKIDNYLEQMNMRINTFGTVVTVHNGIVDAIINQYYMKAKQSGVNMKVEGKFPVDCAIEAYDLCTIFSNVLSNAYEAAVETEEKKISLVCGYTERNIIIAVENSCRNELSSGGLRWKTKKDNSDYHGYGLENIKDSVKKYDGIFDIEIKDNKCMLKILFNHKKESEVEELE